MLSALAQISERVPAEIAEDAAADGAHDVHGRTDALEGNARKQVKEEQEKQQAGDTDGAPA